MHESVDYRFKVSKFTMINMLPEHLVAKPKVLVSSIMSKQIKTLDKHLKQSF